MVGSSVVSCPFMDGSCFFSPRLACRLARPGRLFFAPPKQQPVIVVVPVRGDLGRNTDVVALCDLADQLSRMGMVLVLY